ncbi:hypothetical protein KEM56_004855, partial [Ascosphaera pollenicola]
PALSLSSAVPPASTQPALSVSSAVPPASTQPALSLSSAVPPALTQPALSPSSAVPPAPARDEAGPSTPRNSCPTIQPLSVRTRSAQRHGLRENLPPKSYGDDKPKLNLPDHVLVQCIDGTGKIAIKTLAISKPTAKRIIGNTWLPPYKNQRMVGWKHEIKDLKKLLQEYALLAQVTDVPASKPCERCAKEGGVFRTCHGSGCSLIEAGVTQGEVLNVGDR